VHGSRSADIDPAVKGQGRRSADTDPQSKGQGHTVMTSADGMSIRVLSFLVRR